MKNRTHGEADRYWWTCYAGAQNDGKGCDFWKLLDMLEEKRGPCVGFEKPTSSDDQRASEVLTKTGYKHTEKVL